MKKNIIALAVASAIAAPVAMADAPTLYGKLNLNINNIEDGDTSINSVDSRIGVKGSEDLGNGLKAVYKVEFKIDDVADGSGEEDSTLGSRNQYLGLAGGFGTVLMGRHDIPTKMIQPKDLFGDGAADIKNLTNGLYNGETRAADVLAYVSPSFSGVKVIAATVLDEKGRPDAPAGTNWDNIAVTYGSTKKGLYLSGALQDASDKDFNVIRIGAQYKTGGLIVNAMHQANDGDDTSKGNFTQLQAGYKIGKFMPKVKFVTTNNETYKDDGDADTKTKGSAYAVGLNYSLGKKTTAYIYTTDRNDVGKKNASFIGMVHKF